MAQWQDLSKVVQQHGFKFSSFMLRCNISIHFSHHPHLAVSNKREACTALGGESVHVGRQRQDLQAGLSLRPRPGWGRVI
jgi:hypothetical protein